MTQFAVFVQQDEDDLYRKVVLDDDHTRANKAADAYFFSDPSRFGDKIEVVNEAQLKPFSLNVELVEGDAEKPKRRRKQKAVEPELEGALADDDPANNDDVDTSGDPFSASEDDADGPTAEPTDGEGESEGKIRGFGRRSAEQAEEE